MSDFADFIPAPSAGDRFSPYQTHSGHMFQQHSNKQFTNVPRHTRGSRPPYRGGRGTQRKMPPRAHPEPTATSSAPVSARTGNRPSQVQHEKKQAKPSGLLMYQVPTYIDVFCSNQGLRFICSLYFNNLQGRDQRMAQMLSALQFEYVTCLAYFYRLAVVNRDSGIPGPFQDLSDLRDAVQGIELPALILRYVETLGLVELQNGIKIRPFYTNDLQADPLMVSPADILAEAGRPIPPGHWSIDRQWIAEWNAHTTRASRRSFGFGQVDNSILTGKPELVVSFQETLPDIYRPRAPLQLSDEEAKLGVCHRWRDYDQQPLYPGGDSGCIWAPFYGTEFNPTLFYENLVVASITSD